MANTGPIGPQGAQVPPPDNSGGGGVRGATQGGTTNTTYSYGGWSSGDWDTAQAHFENDPASVASAYAASHKGKTSSQGEMLRFFLDNLKYAGDHQMSYEQAWGGGSGVGGGGGGGGGGRGSGVSAAAAAARQAAAMQSAKYSVNEALKMYGLENMAGWAWGELTDLNSPKTPAEVLADLRGTNEYLARFPGMMGRAANGYDPMTEAQYIAYENAAQQLANQVGLPAGMMSKDAIAKLIAGNVSVTELQQRLVNGYQAAMQAPQQVRDALKNYYGIDTGHLAGYYLDPSAAGALIQQRQQTATIGGLSQITGFGSLTKQQAEQIQQVPGMTATEARTVFDKLAPMTSLEQTQLGMRGQATASQNALLKTAIPGAVPGMSAADAQAQVQAASEARTAGLRGGGGFAQAQKGVVGVGRAGTEGIGNA